MKSVCVYELFLYKLGEDTTESSIDSDGDTRMKDESPDASAEENTSLENQRADAVSPRPAVDTDNSDFMHLDPSSHGFHSDSDDDDSSLSLQQNTSNYASSIVDEESLHSQVSFSIVFFVYRR